MFGNGGSNLANGVTVTVNWIIKPELVNNFVATLETMFQQTRPRVGFRNIRLLRSDADLTEIVPLGCATCLLALLVLTPRATRLEWPRDDSCLRRGPSIYEATG